MRLSLILRTTTRFLAPVMLLFSIFLLFRGHNNLGGGFSGGLIAASAYGLYTMAYGAEEAQAALPVNPPFIIGIGLLLSLFGGLIPLLRGDQFLESKWASLEVGPTSTIELGTPLLFDTGIYLIVLGVITTIIVVLERSYTPLVSEEQSQT